MLPEFIQRRMGTVVSGFNFYGSNLLSFRDQEIDLHMVFAILTITTGIEIQAWPTMAKHLRNNVFHQHSLVDIQPVKEDCAIKFVIRVFLILESVSHKQPCVCHITLLRGIVSAQSKPDMRVCCIETGIYHHCLIQPYKGILIGSKAGLFSERGRPVFLFLFGKLSRNAIEHDKHLVLIALCKLCDILPVKIQDSAFGNIGCLEVFAVPVSNNGLRHTAYEDVLAEIIHDLSVKSCPKRFLCFKGTKKQVWKSEIRTKKQVDAVASIPVGISRMWLSLLSCFYITVGPFS